MNEHFRTDERRKKMHKQMKDNLFGLAINRGTYGLTEWAREWCTVRWKLKRNEIYQAGSAQAKWAKPTEKKQIKVDWSL